MTVIEEGINDISKWMTANKLKLNEDKTELLVILPSHQTHKCYIESINIGGCEVRKSESVRNVGVIFYFTMQMKNQVTSLVKSCQCWLPAIGKIRQYLSRDAATNNSCLYN